MRNTILTLAFLLFGLISFCQTDTTSFVNPTYRKMLVENELLFAINEKGQVTIWDLKTLDKKYEMQDTIPQFSAVSSDKEGNIFFGTRNGQIFKYKQTDNKFEPFLELKKELPISKILFILF